MIPARRIDILGPNLTMNKVSTNCGLSPLDINVNTTLKYYRKQALNKKLKLKIYEKVTGHEIFSSTIPWAMK